jgi:hypothetical protein
MSVPQDSRARRIQKKRRTKKLAQWRVQQQAADQPENAAAATATKQA